jgi:soluble cytochrome b562
MIFSTLFKTKATWQHKDATTRITAINNELSLSDNEHSAILHNMVKSDDSDLVRRAALLKIASLAVFVDASRNNSLEKVKQFATQQVHDILSTNHDVEVSKAEKHELLEQQTQDTLLNVATLEAWFFYEKQSDIIIKLYQLLFLRKKSSQFLLQCFNQKQDATFQHYIINQVDDIKTLEKLIKKTNDVAVTSVIETKIASTQAKIEAPLKLTKQIQLTLAKLQALKDIADYGAYKQRKVKLLKDWQELTLQFKLLTADEVTNFTDKQIAILAHLDKLFVAKAENYQQQIIADKLAHDKQQDKKVFSQELNHINQSITTAVFSNDKLDEPLFKHQLIKLTEAIKTSTLNDNEQQSFIEEVKHLTTRLGSIPEIAEYVSQATHLISKISQLSLPSDINELNDKQQAYHDWLKAWKVIEQKTLGILPESIVQSQKQIVNTWQNGLKPFQSKQKELFFQHKKKLQDIKRLLNIGKYKVCFGLFKGVKETISFLSIQQVHQLQKDFEQIEKRMAELADWESYIATPRKQGLLKAIQALVVEPLDNPNEQAAKVKEYRNTWNSLGHADEAVDKSLNENFNELCEQAFAPCRLFFAEQDKLREEHLQQRRNILSNAEQLISALNESTANQTVDFKKYDNQLNQLQQQWANAGEVDRNHHKKLEQEFRQVIKPIKEAITQFHLDNVEQKNRLINQAQILLDNDDVYLAIETAKKLQQTWRSVGFAGNPQENILWQKFRQINDQLFAQRQALKSVEKAELASQQENLDAQLVTFGSRLNSAVNQADKPSLLVMNTEVETLLEHVLSQPSVLKNIVSKLEKMKGSIVQAISQIDETFAKQSWSSLFTLMSAQAINKKALDDLKVTTEFGQLTSFWQKRLIEHNKLSHQADKYSRSEKTTEIEVLANVESPKELSEQRMAVQVKLMQQQMLSGGNIDLSKELVNWLILGQLNTTDLPLLERLKKVFVER